MTSQLRTASGILTILIALGLPLTAVAAREEPAEICSPSETVFARPANDPNADGFGYGPWYINADRSIWAGWDAPRMVAGERGNKVLWIRPAGTQLQIRGRMIGGEGETLLAHISEGYPTGFQATGLIFSAPGCWEISASAGESRLVFVTLVR